MMKWFKNVTTVEELRKEYRSKLSPLSRTF